MTSEDTPRAGADDAAASSDERGRRTPLEPLWIRFSSGNLLREHQRRMDMMEPGASAFLPLALALARLAAEEDLIELRPKRIVDE